MHFIRIQKNISFLYMNLRKDKEYKVKMPANSNTSRDEYGYASLIFKKYIDDYYNEVDSRVASGLLFVDPYDSDEEPIVIVKSNINVGDILPTNVSVAFRPSRRYRTKRNRTGGKKSRKHKKSKKQ